jgi:predicted metal-dependent phosphoesterase TrpH
MIDLHIHSDFSDGTDSVDKIVDKVIHKNITRFSITDHDTIEGNKALLGDQLLLNKLTDNNIEFVTGVEFSGIIGKDKIHILGYNFDVGSNEIAEVVNLGWQKRQNKFILRLDALKNQLGIEYSEESLNEMKKLNFLGKPIMANYLVKDGIFENRDEAIINGLHKLKINPMETRIDAEIIIKGIKQSGGVSVWAHPLGGLNERRISFEHVEEILQKLVPLGLQGLECYYNLYTSEENNRLVEIANKYNLLITAGSDYHGKNKTADIGEVLNLKEFDATDKCTLKF